MKYLFILIVMIFISNDMLSQSAHKLLREGDKAYKREQFQKAEESYRKALEKKNSKKGEFNLGNTVYSQDRFEEAIEHYQKTVEQSGTEEERANALYNLGNAQLRAGQLDGAVDAFKQATLLNRSDQDMLRNLYMAKMMQKQQQQEQQQQQQQQSNQNQDQQNQNQDQQQQEQNQDDQQQQQQSEINNEGEQEEEAPQTQEMSKEDALKLLKVIENEEKNVQEKMRKLSSKKKKPKKDW